MLALTHHFIVAYSAKKAGYQWGTFWNYAVLGDDIVIADRLVATEYLKVLSSLGVKVGLAKSLISHKGRLEFAKRYLAPNDVDLSPVPFKELGAALVSFNNLTALARKYGLDARVITRILGKSYRVLGRLATRFHGLPRALRSFVA
jgi:hypothetical protein